MKFLSLICLFIAQATLGQQLIDPTGIFPQQQQQNIQKIIRSIYDQSKIDINILANSNANQEYQSLLNSWRSQSSTSPNKILITILSSDRKINIENSLELNSKFNKTYKRELISNIMAPSFKLRDYSSGTIQALLHIGKNLGTDLYEVSPNQFTAPFRLKKNILTNDWILPFFLGSFILYLIWIKFLGYSPNNRFVFGVLFFGSIAYLGLGKLPVQILFLSLLGGYLFWSGFTHIVPDPVNIHETSKKPLVIILYALVSIALSFALYHYTKLSSISVLVGFILFGFASNKNRVYFSNKNKQDPYPNGLSHIGGSGGEW